MMPRFYLSLRLMLVVVAGGLSACSAPLSTLPEAALAQKAQAGDAQAQYVLAGKLAARGEYGRALTLMKQAASQSAASDASRSTRADAARQAGDWYHNGLGEPRNEALARHWWTRASSLGNAQASMDLAGHCQAEHGTSPVADCISQFEKAAQQGNAEAQLMLARWYQTQPEGEKRRCPGCKKRPRRKSPPPWPCWPAAMKPETV